MNKHEAKQGVCRAAWLILSSGPIPTSACEDGDTPASESSSRNSARWEKAWNELLTELFRRGYPDNV
jgi:hypothetical protein